MNEELKIILTAEIKKFKDNIKAAQKQVKDFVKEGTKDFGAMNKEFQKYGDAAKKGLAVAGAAVAGAATALLSLSGATEEYRSAQAKLTSAFEAAGSDVETARGAYEGLQRVLGESDVAVEAAAHLAKMTTNEKELAEWTKACQGIFATFGDSLPIESLTEAANETAKVGQVTGSLADALNWAGISEDDFNAKLEKCNNEAEREKLIRETLSKTYDKAAESYEKNAAEIIAQNEAQEKLNETMAELGEAMTPINTALAEFGTVLLEQLQPIITDFVENHGETIKQTLTDIAEKIGNVLNWVIDNWDLVKTIAAIILGIAVALTVFSTVMGIVNAVMLASPVTWIVLGIVAAVAALVAIIIVCIKYWDEIREATKKCWDAIVNAVKVAIDWVINLFTSIFSWVKENWQGLLLLLVNPFAGAFKLIYDNCEGFRNIVDNITTEIKEFFARLWENIKNIFKGVGKWFKDTFNAAVKGVKDVFGGIGSFFSGIWDKIKGIFANVGSAVAGAITNTVKTAINGVLTTATNIINGFIKAINIVISVINAIPGVNIKKLDTLSVPKLAKGGIVDSATLAVIGEQGKEAVVPLENNMQWLDKIATMLNDKQGNRPIVLKVGEKVFGEIAANSINELTKQTGAMPLIIR